MAATEINLAMAQYRIEIGKITTENADALFAFSTLLTIYVLSTSATEYALTLNTFRTVENRYNDSTKLTSSMVDTMCRVFRSVRGVLVILVPCWHHLQSGPLQPVVQRDWWPAAVPETEEEVSNDEKLRQVEKIWSRPDRAYDYSFDTLRIALKSLQESFALVSKLERLGWTSKGNGKKGFDWTSILHWPVQLPLDFLLLLEQRHVEAWVIVAHFAMLTDKARDITWLEGLSTNIITTAALVIGEENWSWIEWPVDAIGFDLELLQTPVAASIPTTSPQPPLSLELNCPCSEQS